MFGAVDISSKQTALEAAEKSLLEARKDLNEENLAKREIIVAILGEALCKTVSFHSFRVVQYDCKFQ